MVSVPCSLVWLRFWVVTYSHWPSRDTVIPIGLIPSWTSPTKPDVRSPLASAARRLNTAIVPLFSSVTNANWPSPDSVTSTAPSPCGLVRVPSTLPGDGARRAPR